MSSAQAAFPGKRFYLPDDHKTVPEVFRDAGYFTFNNGKDDYNFARDRSMLYTTGNDGREPDGKVNGGVSLQRGSGDWRECPADMPFFAQIQTNGGKDGYTAEQAAGVLQGLGVEDPKLVNPDDVTVPPQYPDIPEMREMVANQLNTMLISDILVGQMVERLKADGHWGNTIIFFLSDHGALFPRAKQMCYEEGLHVPLMAAAPDMPEFQKLIPPGTRRREPVATPGRGRHIAGTRRDHGAGLHGLRQPFRGDRSASTCSRRGTAANGWWTGSRSAIGDRYHYIRNFMTDRPVAQPNFREVWPAITRTRELYERGELTPAQASAYGPRPEEELYDLQDDPHETVNLADDPGHNEILKAMRALVEAWIADTDDRGAVPGIERRRSPVTKQQFRKWCTDPIFDDV